MAPNMSRPSMDLMTILNQYPRLKGRKEELKKEEERVTHVIEKYNKQKDDLSGQIQNPTYVRYRRSLEAELESVERTIKFESIQLMKIETLGLELEFKILKTVLDEIKSNIPNPKKRDEVERKLIQYISSSNGLIFKFQRHLLKYQTSIDEGSCSFQEGELRKMIYSLSENSWKGETKLKEFAFVESKVCCQDGLQKVSEAMKSADIEIGNQVLGWLEEKIEKLNKMHKGFETCLKDLSCKIQNENCLSIKSIMQMYEGKIKELAQKQFEYLRNLKSLELSLRGDQDEKILKRLGNFPVQHGRFGVISKWVVVICVLFLLFAMALATSY